MGRARVAVYGDVMVDRDIDVSVVYDIEGSHGYKTQQVRTRLGAAGAVVNMLQALGCETTLASVSGGSKEEITELDRLIPGYRLIMRADGPQTSRTRYWSDNGRVGPRVDVDGSGAVSFGDEGTLVSAVGSFRPDVIIVCDHGRGVVTRTCIDRLRSIGVPIYVDPCVRSHWQSFAGVEVVSMNRTEALACTDAFDPEPKHIIQHCDVDGLWWYRDGWWCAPPVAPGESDSHRLWFGTAARQVVDTIGAGDQFIAALAAGRAAGNDWECAILEANIAAGLQCERRGIVPVTWSEIRGYSPVLEPSDALAGASGES